MKHYSLSLALLISMVGSLFVSAQQRDPLKQPFSKTSIWNMPIHKDAQYVPARIGAPLYGFYSDEEVIILKPTAPLTGIYGNYADWDATKDRCIKQGSLIFSAPIPTDFVYSKNEWKGTTPNSGLAILMADGVTIKHTQPFARCTAGTDATSHYKFPSQNLTGDGTRGGHGGSGLSTLGGTIRLGELVPGGKINHALKIDLYGAKYYFYDAVTKGFRWPAVNADGYAAGNYGTKGTPAEDCRIGALLAIPKSVTIESLNLETEPGKIMAEAFRSYGAYIVDDAAWDAVNICTEHSPDGTVLNEFSGTWGFEFETSKGQPFANDLEKILKNLNVVINNTATTIGGGLNTDETNRLAPMACDFAPAGSGKTCNGIVTSSSIINIGKKECELKIFPNPVNISNITFVIPNNERNIKMEIFDYSGKLIFSKINISENEFKLAPSCLRGSGMYLVRVTSSANVQYAKLILD